MTVKSSISLTDDQHNFAKKLVDKGRYPSVSAVLQQGVELLRQQIESDALEREALREVLAERRSGKFLATGDMDSRLTRLIERKRRAHGLQD